MSGKRYDLKDLDLPTDEPVVIIRSSFLWICDGDKYAAAALNMYVRWTRWIMKHRPVAEEMNRLRKKQGKKPNQDTSLILYRRQSALVQDLLGFCSEKRLRQANTLLISKGLLKIDDTPRSISDHVLKYELQIDMFRKLLGEWKEYREKMANSEDDDVVEISLEDESDGTDNLPSRSGKSSASSSVRNGKFTDQSGKNAASNNRGSKRDDTLTDDEGRESATSQELTDSTEQTDSPTSSNKNLNEKKIGQSGLVRGFPPPFMGSPSGPATGVARGIAASFLPQLFLQKRMEEHNVSQKEASTNEHFRMV